MSAPLDPRLRKLLDALPEPLRRDPKQTAVLGGLLVAFVGVMAFQFGRGGGADEAEAAAPTAPAALAVATPAAPKRATPRDERPSTAARVARWLESPAVALDRNVFALRLENFQATPTAAPAAAAADRPAAARLADEGLFWDDLARSLSVRADQRRQRQIWIDNLTTAAGQIHVATTIMGPVPAAMVNRRRVKAGDVVEVPIPGGTGDVAFRIVAVEPRRVIVDRDGIKFEVPLGGGARAMAAAE